MSASFPGPIVGTLAAADQANGQPLCLQSPAPAPQFDATSTLADLRRRIPCLYTKQEDEQKWHQDTDFGRESQREPLGPQSQGSLGASVPSSEPKEEKDGRQPSLPPPKRQRKAPQPHKSSVLADAPKPLKAHPEGPKVEPQPRQLERQGKMKKEPSGPRAKRGPASTRRPRQQPVFEWDAVVANAGLSMPSGDSFGFATVEDAFAMFGDENRGHEFDFTEEGIGL